MVQIDLPNSGKVLFLKIATASTIVDMLDDDD